MGAAEKHIAQRGSILVFTLVFAIIVAAAAAALVAESRAGLMLREMENERFRTFMDCLNGLEIARSAVETSSYDAWGHNLALWSIDSTPDGLPGAIALVENDRARVTVSYLGDSWYELHSTATSEGGMKREAKRRVREKDSLSRYALFVEDGDVRIGETTSYYGPVHVNGRAIFNDSTHGVGTQVYGFMSSTLPFHFFGSAQKETSFHQGFTDNLGPGGSIELPDAAALSAYKAETGAYRARGTVLWKAGAQDDEAQLRRGTAGFSVTGNVNTYIELSYNRITRTQYVRFTIRTKSGSTLFASSLDRDYVMPNPAIIHVEKGIAGLRGELHGAATIVSEMQDVCLTGDIYYVDDEGERPMVFNPSEPGNGNYTSNPNYDGSAVLGVIARRNVLYTGADDDRNLEVNAVLMAMTGQVRWGGTAGKDHLRVFGARISYGRTYRYSRRGSGYDKSGVYVYDDNLRIAPPPKFLAVHKPLFLGFQVVE